jgi:membrane-associated protein
VRTFAPFTAGLANMRYGVFLRFNVIGGISWVLGLTLLGYFFGLVGHRDVLGDVAIQDVIREEAEFCCLPVDLIEEDLTL